MFSYENRQCLFYFILFCVAMWFSFVLALLARAQLGRRRRCIARETMSKLDTRKESISAAARQASKAVLRRAVVIVGGDFARSPRMQYHATSLARCGMFDEIVLVGFDVGNRLSEALRNASSEACVVNTRYLVRPFKPPSWMECVLFERRIYWIGATIYRLCAYVLLFSWIIVRASVMRLSEHGQLLLTDILLVQAPPTVPVVPLIKYTVRPIVFIANALLYYGFIVPASWLMYDALREIREGLKLQQQLSQEQICRFPSKEARAAKPPTARKPRWVMWPALVVDWHNFGHTILRSDGRPLLAVFVYWFFERYLCWGDRNITVSKAMRDELLCAHKDPKGKKKKTMELVNKNSTGDDVVVLYDTAPTFFGPVQRNQFVRDVLLPITRTSALHNPQCGSKDVEERMGIAQPPPWMLNEAMRLTDTREEFGDVNNTCPAGGIFMVAATSWTAEDDYSIVVEALVELDKRLQVQQEQQEAVSPVRPLWLLVTGKGEMRKRFEEAVIAAALSPLVTVTTIYFQSYKEYAMALGAADVGLCVHYSSSGLDLPMKAVDMLGSGLPVIAWRYAALPEMLDDKCAWLFSNAEELENILWNYVLSPNTDANLLKEKKRYVLQRRTTWDDSWQLSVLPLVRELT